MKGKYASITNIARTVSSAAQTGRFDSEIAAALPDSVKSVSHCGAGYDQIDPQPLLDRKIQLSNVTTPVEAPTALTAVFLALSALRNYQIGHNLLVDGQWPEKGEAGAPLGRDPEGLTVGILGMGGIGQAIRDRLLPFGFARIVYHNRLRLEPDLEGPAEYLNFDDFLAQLDVIMVTVPLNANTHHLINAKTLAKMKEGVVLVNTARGAVIDEAALITSLRSGKVGSFGADVFENEPEVPKELREMANVVLLPHMGTFTSQARRNMEEFVVENIEHQIKTGKVKTIVPEQKNLEF